MVSNVSHWFGTCSTQKCLKGDLKLNVLRVIFDNSNTLSLCMITWSFVIAVIACFLLTPGIKSRTSTFLHK